MWYLIDMKLTVALKVGCFADKCSALLWMWLKKQHFFLHFFFKFVSKLFFEIFVENFFRNFVWKFAWKLFFKLFFEPIFLLVIIKKKILRKKKKKNCFWKIKKCIWRIDREFCSDHFHNWRLIDFRRLEVKQKNGTNRPHSVVVCRVHGCKN